MRRSCSAVLRVLNRELGADFDPETLAHRAVWDVEHEWIEMRPESLADVVRSPTEASPQPRATQTTLAVHSSSPTAWARCILS